jgi:hypothetical protein
MCNFSFPAVLLDQQSRMLKIARRLANYLNLAKDLLAQKSPDSSQLVFRIFSTVSLDKLKYRGIGCVLESSHSVHLKDCVVVRAHLPRLITDQEYCSAAHTPHSDQAPARTASFCSRPARLIGVSYAPLILRCFSGSEFKPSAELNLAWVVNLRSNCSEISAVIEGRARSLELHAVKQVVKFTRKFEREVLSYLGVLFQRKVKVLDARSPQDWICTRLVAESECRRLNKARLLEPLFSIDLG